MLAVLRGPCGVTGLPSTSTRNIANHLSSSWSHTGLTHNPLSFIISTSWTQTSGYHRSKKDLSIILLKDQPLGLKGERVKVRPGFFRNWLYPNKLATYDIRENRLKYPPPSKEALEEREKQRALKRAQKRLASLVVIVKRHTMPDGKLHAPVYKENIAEKLMKQHLIQVDPKDIDLAEPINQYGEFDIPMIVNEQRTPVKIRVIKR